LSETWLSDKGVYDADRSMVVEGMLPSVGAPTREDYYAEKMGYLPFNKRSRMTIRIQESLEPGETKEIRIRGAGQMVLIRNAASDQDEWDLSGIRPEDIPEITNDSFVTIGGEFTRKPRLNNNYQTGNLPSLGTLTKIKTIPTDADYFRLYCVMDSSGNIYFTFNDGSNERVASIDYDHEARWSVIASTYSGKTNYNGFPRLTDDHLYLMGNIGIRVPFMYSKEDGSDANTHLTLYENGGADYFVQGSKLYCDYRSAYKWRACVANTGLFSNFFSSTLDVLSGTMSLFSGDGYCSWFSGASRALYKGSWDAAVTKLLDNWQLCAQDENGAMYGWNKATGDFERRSLAGALVWNITTATIDSGGYFYYGAHCVAVDEYNGIVYLTYGNGSTGYMVCAIDRDTGVIIWNRKIQENPNIGTSSANTFLCTAVDKYGIMVGFNEFSPAAVSYKENLFIYNINTDTVIWEKYEAGTNDEMQTYGLFSQCLPQAGGGPCTGWGKLVWVNPSSDASNVGGIYVLT